MAKKLSENLVKTLKYLANEFLANFNFIFAISLTKIFQKTSHRLQS